MVDISLLKEKIDDSGMKMVAISNKAGIERATLYNRLNGVGDFTVTEVSGLTKALGLSKAERDEIFFC